MPKRDPSVVVPFFRRALALEGVPELAVGRPPAPAEVAPADPVSAAVDLSGKPKVWFLIGPGSSGKTAEARWLIWRMTEQGRQSVLAALDPGNRSLASWFGNVDQPPTRDGTQTARWLLELLELLANQKASAVVDFGGGDTSLEKALDAAPDLVSALAAEGLGLVACYVLTPRIDDLDTLATLEAHGFQPPATAILLNAGRADPTIAREDAFAPVMAHSAYRKALARGAVPLWMPALESDVMAEIEAKRLHFGLARDGQVPAGATFPPIGGLRRSMIRRWLDRMERAHQPVATWLP